MMRRIIARFQIACQRRRLGTARNARAAGILYELLLSMGCIKEGMQVNLIAYLH